MSYPVILYPRLITQFLRQNQLPISVATKWHSAVVETDAVKGRHGDAVKGRHGVHKSPVFLMVEIGLVTVAFVGAISSTWLLGVGAGMALFIVAGVWLRHQEKGKPPSSPQPVSVVSASPTAFKTVVADQKTQLRDYLSQLAEMMSGRVLKPEGVSNAPVGTSERAFGEVLNKFFPGRVKTQLSFPLPNGHCYSTDFALEFPELGIYIDCEVDEPYDFKSNHPTHCTDDDHDKFRNTFFLKGNWIVVRFAEEQVVLHPESCCKELAFVIAAITGIEVYSKQLRPVPILQPMQQWTKRQAKKMAKASYRNRYLFSNPVRSHRC